jgi:hypothetical protein
MATFGNNDLDVAVGGPLEDGGGKTRGISQHVVVTF